MAIAAPPVRQEAAETAIDFRELADRLVRDVNRCDIVRVPMSLQQFDEFACEFKTEWVDGVTLIMPPTPYIHASLAVQLSDLFRDNLPQLLRLYDTYYAMPNRVRAPDLALIARPPSGPVVTSADPPVITVEVLSPSTRTEDLGAKAAEYAASGVFQYWTVDPRTETITARQNDNGQWVTIAVVDAAHPTAEIPVGEYGTVAINHRELFPPEDAT